MKFTSTIFAATSGSIAGATFSRNRGGQYVRRRAIPSNPNSEAQGLARTNLAAAVSMWTNNLSSADRDGWRTYAQGTPTIDHIGQSIILSGQQMYVRSATVMAALGLAMPSTAPTDVGLGYTPDWVADPVVTASDNFINGSLTIPDPDTTAHFGLYISRPVGASRTPAHETRRLIIGPTGAATNPTTVADAESPFELFSGQFVRVTTFRVDAQSRVSAISFRDVEVAP